MQNIKSTLAMVTLRSFRNFVSQYQKNTDENLMYVLGECVYEPISPGSFF